MKPNFALDLTHEGIALLHRTSRNTWNQVGAVSLDDRKVKQSLSFLRKTAVALEGKTFGSKLIIPNSQILYTTVYAPGPDPQDLAAQVATALIGQTPYEVEDLSYDWVIDGDNAHVAVVARETLEEAEDFAIEHRFNPLVFCAKDTPEEFTREPNFGKTDYAVALLGIDAEISLEDTPSTPPQPLVEDDTDWTEPETDGPFDDDPFDDDAPEIEEEDLVATVVIDEDVLPPVVEPDPPAPAFSTRRSADREATDRPDSERLIETRPSRLAFAPEEVEPPALGGVERSDASTTTTAAHDRPPFWRRVFFTFRRQRSAPTEVVVADETPAPDDVANEPDAPRRGKRRAIIAALVLAVFLGALGALSGVFDPTSEVSEAARQAIPDGSDVLTVSLTGDDTRPESRDAHLTNLDLPDGDGEVLPLTSLSQQELADIEAAGLSAFDIGQENEPLFPTEEMQAEIAAELEELYAESGILQGIAYEPTPPRIQRRGDIFISNVDRGIGVDDAIALPSYHDGPGEDRPSPPLPAVDPSVTFDVDERGLVKATSDGVISQDGILIVLARPVILPPQKPDLTALLPPDTRAEIRPLARPTDLDTTDPVKELLARLEELRPKARPESEQALAPPSDGTPSKLAVLASDRPSQRPSDFFSIVEKTRETLIAINPTDGADPTDLTALNTGPQIPTRASVAKVATIKNAIDQTRLNLIGVYGTASNRRALMRLPSGRFVKVETGDRVDGGRIAAISESSVSYVKAGRNRVIHIPD